MGNIVTARKPYMLMIPLVVTREARGSLGWQPVRPWRTHVTCRADSRLAPSQ